MSTKLNLALRRALKVVAAASVAALIGWLSGPDVASIFGQQGAVIVTVLLIPLLSGLEKGYLSVTS